jgi:hypothetical protein
MKKSMPSLFLRNGLLLAAATVLSGFSDLSRDQLKILQDPGGWDYIKMTDTGMQTEHPCFDGKPHPELCSGRLTFSTDNKFMQEVTIKGETVPRHGTYTLEDDQLTLFDELETRDGPYTIEIDAQQKSLLMYTSAVRIELILHKTLHDKKRKETK